MTEHEDTRRLRWMANEPILDFINNGDVHAQAAIYASYSDRQEPNEDDYLAAFRDAVDDGMDEGDGRYYWARVITNDSEEVEVVLLKGHDVFLIDRDCPLDLRSPDDSARVSFLSPVAPLVPSEQR